MCGICGFSWPDKQLISKLILVLKHRGPDARGAFVDDFVSLGHVRLSIIDLSKRANQPMPDANKELWITYNGEIYNYKQIREDLEKKGYRFDSTSDTEVILSAYKEYGAECLRYFRGMFAFAIYDSRNKIIFIARDQFGIKPLYYYFDGANFMFASEIKALLASEHIAPILNKTAVNKFLSFRFVPGRETLFSGIEKLEPATYITFDIKKKTMTKSRYYSLEMRELHGSDAALTENMLLCLRNSVSDHMIADVEVGTFLSGGIDSSTITALAQGITDKGKLKTFSADFDFFSEDAYAKEVSEFLGVEHKKITITAKDAINALDRVVWHFDEPAIDPGNIPTFLLSEFSKRFVKVVLTGDGGDEAFAGYDYYKRFLNFNKLSHFIPRLLGNNRWLATIRSAKSAEEYYIRMHENMNFMGSPIGKVTFPEINTNSQFSRLQFFDLNFRLAEYFNMKIDKMAMANALEVRTPYLYPSVLSLAHSMPAHMLCRNGVNKYILKQCARNLVPNSVITRKKVGYGIPIAAWFRGELGEIARQELASPEISAIFGAEELKNKIDTLARKKQYFNLWFLFMFNRWYKEYLL